MILEFQFFATWHKIVRLCPYSWNFRGEFNGFATKLGRKLKNKTAVYTRSCIGNFIKKTNDRRTMLSVCKKTLTQKKRRVTGTGVASFLPGNSVLHDLGSTRVKANTPWHISLNSSRAQKWLILRVLSSLQIVWLHFESPLWIRMLHGFDFSAFDLLASDFSASRYSTQFSPKKRHNSKMA